MTTFKDLGLSDSTLEALTHLGYASPTPIQGRWTIHGLGLPDEVLDDIYVNNATRLFGPPPGAKLEKKEEVRE